MSPEPMNSASHVRGLLKAGAAFCIIVLAGIFIDVFAGIYTGGNLTELPNTAIERFGQFRENRMLGLYNLDLLNAINQFLLIPVYLSLVIAHRKLCHYQAFTAFTIFFAGSLILISNNTALPMMDLSNKYFATNDENMRTLYAAAGEALLVRGAHGSSSMLLGFLIPNAGGLIMSIVMLKGKIFTPACAWFGITGSILMIIYILCVTFVPAAKQFATLLAMPGGILLIIWMILFTKGLIILSKHSHT